MFRTHFSLKASQSLKCEVNRALWGPAFSSQGFHTGLVRFGGGSGSLSSHRPSKMGSGVALNPSSSLMTVEKTRERVLFSFSETRQKQHSSPPCPPKKSQTHGFYSRWRKEKRLQGRNSFSFLKPRQFGTVPRPPPESVRSRKRSRRKMGKNERRAAPVTSRQW